jgi:hypothetical protein
MFNMATLEDIGEALALGNWILDELLLVLGTLG